MRGAADFTTGTASGSSAEASVRRNEGIATIGFGAGTAGSVSPGFKCFSNSARSAWNFGVARPASSIGAS